MSRLIGIGLVACTLLVSPAVARAGGVIVTWGETLPDSVEDPNSSADPMAEPAEQQVIHAEAGDPIRALLAKMVWASLSYDPSVDVENTTPSIQEALIAQQEGEDDDTDVTMSQALPTGAAEGMGAPQAGCSQTGGGSWFAFVPLGWMVLRRRRR